MKSILFQVDNESDGLRLDQFLASMMESYSRSFLQKCITEQKVLVNDVAKKSRYMVKEGDYINVKIPEPENVEIEPQNIPIDIIYEDDHLVVINKAQNMVVHPSAGHSSGTLVNALLFHCKGKLSGINGMIRPGIVHRIDKDTSGLLVVAKTDQAHSSLSSQLADHSMQRSYEAIVRGVIAESHVTIEAPIGRHPSQRKKMAVVKDGKPAVTHIKVLKNYAAHTHVKAELETGRTHQIRVHMAYIGHPIIGDELYSRPGRRFNLKGQVLHARELGFTHPASGEHLQFKAPVPEDFLKVLTSLEE